VRPLRHLVKDTRHPIDARLSTQPPFHLFTTTMNAPPALGYPPGVSLAPRGA
jgi:hypothetical protein